MRQRLIDPFIMPLVIIGVTAAMIITVGRTLLAVFEAGDTKDRLDRIELWLALGLALAVIFGMGFLATRPKGTTGILEKDVAIGNRAFFEAPLPPIDVRARSGPIGTVSDIQPGYTLYAQNGALAKAHGLLPGSTDYGKRFGGFIYAEGMHGASPELWIPIEAVMSVYPETRSAFLAIKGDESEAFGWNTPPESVRLKPPLIREPF